MKKVQNLRCDFGIGDSIGHIIIWLLLTIVTFGLALFVFPYYFAKAIVNKTSVLADDNISVVGKLKCDINLGAAVGNAFLWLLLTIVTLGFAYIIYFYRVIRIVLSETTIEYREKEHTPMTDSKIDDGKKEQKQTKMGFFEKSIEKSAKKLYEKGMQILNQTNDSLKDYGVSLKEDELEKASGYLTKSAEMGYAPALYMLGKSYAGGKGEQQRKGIEMLKVAAKKEYEPAQKELAELREKAKEAKDDAEEW